MPWWGWVLIGTLLLAGELFVVEAEFYLVFVGVAAVAVGLLDLAGLGAPIWLEWLLFAAIALGGTWLFRERVYLKLRPPPGGEVGNAVVGELVVVREALAPGERGQAELRGAVWEARNAGPGPLAAGARARVVSMEGLVLNVRAAK